MRSGRTDAAVVGMLAFVLGVVGAGRPSLWVDEAATLSAATRPVGRLWALVQNVDLVHGVYYLLMHGWFAVFPVTEFWARLPSAVLVGIAAAGVVVLCRGLTNPSVGPAAGVVFAVLPRTTAAGIDARPYALTMAAAVWVTVLFVVAVRRPGRRLWVAYSVAIALAAVANVVVLLVVTAHAVLLVVQNPPRRVVVAWAAATAAAVVAISAFLVAISQQQGQIDWIWPVSAVTLGQIVGEQYFPSVYSDSLRAVGPDQQQISAEQLAVAMQAWARVSPVIVVLFVLAVGAVWRRRRGATTPDGARSLIGLAVAWIVVPTVLLVAYSMVARPVYQPQYLAFTTPALAMLAGLCVVVVGRSRREIAAILLVVALAAAPNYLAQRGDYAKYGSDYSQVAELLAFKAAPGDCLSVQATAPSVAWSVEGARLEYDDGLRDVSLDRPAVESADLFGSRASAAAQADRLRECSVLWTVTDAEVSTPGFRPVGEWSFNQTRVVRSERDR